MSNDIIDIHDLPNDDIKFIEKLVLFLREKARIKKEYEKEKVDFASWPLGVKGTLTRKEIYDRL